MLVIVPPGVIHAYKNVGREQGIVFNCPNRLYKGWNRKGWIPGKGVDEIRHEEADKARSNWTESAGLALTTLLQDTCGGRPSRTSRQNAGKPRYAAW